MKYAPTVLIVHPKSCIATLLAQILRDYGFHALPLSNAVDAIEHVENLDFDVAVVSSQMPSALPELLFQANRENWLEVLTMNTPDVWNMAEFMLAVSEAVQERRWMCYLVAEAWHAAWYGEAGYEPGSSWTAKLTEAEWQAQMEELHRGLGAAREHPTNVES